VLLVGPPGTGKTLLAKAVAGEAEVPFFSISASEFVELYVGMGAMRVRELFASARKEAPAIVFIDEIDAVAKGRDMRLRSVGNDEREQTLNQLLTELDGFDSDKEHVVICIAATNRPDVLDPALLRPGRFDRRVAVERPDKVGREQILRVHLNRKGLPLAEDVSVEGISAMTLGFTGADLANLVNEAALLAGRHNKAVVGREEFDAAILRAVAGIEKKRSILQGLEKDVVSKHEVGGGGWRQFAGSSGPVAAGWNVEWFASHHKLGMACASFHGMHVLFHWMCWRQLVGLRITLWCGSCCPCHAHTVCWPSICS
jgi:cell division protease FtsH